MKLSRLWTFEAAHRITSHGGFCRSLHGHSWKVRVSIQGEVNPITGMVMDFQELKAIGDRLFMDQWDHAAILAEWDPLIAPLEKLKSRLYIMSSEPTSENLLDQVVLHITPSLPKRVELVGIEIQETANCSAGLEWRTEEKRARVFARS